MSTTYPIDNIDTYENINADNYMYVGNYMTLINAAINPSGISASSIKASSDDNVVVSDDKYITWGMYSEIYQSSEPDDCKQDEVRYATELEIENGWYVKPGDFTIATEYYEMYNGEIGGLILNATSLNNIITAINDLKNYTIDKKTQVHTCELSEYDSVDPNTSNYEKGDYIFVYHQSELTGDNELYYVSYIDESYAGTQKILTKNIIFQFSSGNVLTRYISISNSDILKVSDLENRDNYNFVVNKNGSFPSKEIEAQTVNLGSSEYDNFLYIDLSSYLQISTFDSLSDGTTLLLRIPKSINYVTLLKLENEFIFIHSENYAFTPVNIRKGLIHLSYYANYFPDGYGFEYESGKTRKGTFVFGSDSYDLLHSYTLTTKYVNAACVSSLGDIINYYVLRSATNSWLDVSLSVEAPRAPYYSYDTYPNIVTANWLKYQIKNGMVYITGNIEIYYANQNEETSTIVATNGVLEAWKSFEDSNRLKLCTIPSSVAPQYPVNSCHIIGVNNFGITYDVEVDTSGNVSIGKARYLMDNRGFGATDKYADIDISISYPL